MTERPPSRSTKSAAASKPQVSKPRIRRRTDIKDLELADVRYIWAAYRQGALKDFDPIFEASMGPDEFQQVFAEYAASVYNGPSWLLSGVTLKGFKPLGFVLTYTRGVRVLEIGAMEWFPWAGKRAILEAVVNLMNALRRDYLVLEFAHQKDETFYRKHIVPRKIMRAVGQVHGLFPDAPAVLFQTRRWGEW